MSPAIPCFDGIDYANPDDYLSLHASFVGSGSLQALTTYFMAPTPQEVLANIWRWIRNEFNAEENQTDYKWRTVTEIIGRKRYFGCAEHALVYGSLTRACRIPTVWVKSLDVQWIREFRRSGDFDGGSGHVFLEVFIQGEWRLLDATEDLLYDEYNPSSRLLPGSADDSRYAYDKGGDPRELILSLDWEPWVVQTKAFFSTFNLQLLDEANHAVTSSGRRLTV